MALFQLDCDRVRRSIADPDGHIWPVGSHSDADELNAFFEAAIEGRVIGCECPSAGIHIYPLSISEPDPVLAVDPGPGPSLLGYSLELREREGESPVEFTLRLLEEVTVEANALATAADKGTR